MRLGGGLGELTYCLNIHPAETWPEARAALEGPVRAVKAALAPDAPFAVGLRLSGRAARDLADPAARAALRALLAAEGYRAITVNGFPHGRFHGVAVKAAVYEPDWRDPERLAYSCALADLMAEIGPPGEPLSLSTVPGGFRAATRGREDAVAEAMLRFAAHAVRLRERTGATVALAVEPEPACLIETTREAAAFFDARLLSDAAARRLALLTGLPRAEAAAALPRHLGLCLDVCHAAVEFEDPAESLAALRAVGAPVHKLQLSAALRVPAATAAARAALAPYAEPTYLHQVVARGPGGALARYDDLPAALASPPSDDEEWRVHFHVPVFVADAGAFATTQDFLAEMLALHARAPIAPHLEVETYTWGVLPPRLAAGSVEAAVIRELRWVLERLAA